MLKRFYRWDHKAGRGDVHSTTRPEIQKAVAVLLDTLPAVLREYEDNGLVDPEVFNPEFEAYDALHQAAKEAATVIGPPPKPKRGAPGDLLWHSWLKALYHPIRAALSEATGDENPSPRDDGALVAVICSALKEVDGKKRENATVGAALRKFITDAQTPRK